MFDLDKACINYVYWAYFKNLHPLGVNLFVDDKVEERNEGNKG